MNTDDKPKDLARIKKGRFGFSNTPNKSTWDGKVKMSYFNSRLNLKFPYDKKLVQIMASIEVWVSEIASFTYDM